MLEKLGSPVILGFLWECCLPDLVALAYVGCPDFQCRLVHTRCSTSTRFAITSDSGRIREHEFSTVINIEEWMPYGSFQQLCVSRLELEAAFILRIKQPDQKHSNAGYHQQSEVVPNDLDIGLWSSSFFHDGTTYWRAP